MRWFSRTTVSLGLAILATLVLFAINETGYSRSMAALDGMSHASSTRSELDRLLQRVLDAETGSRGFLLTGDPRYLEPYQRAVGEIGADLGALRRAEATKNAEFQAILTELIGNVQRKLSEMELLVRMRKEGNEDAWRFVLMTDLGKEHMDAIRAQAGKMMALAATQIETSQQQVEHSLQLARIGIATVALAGLAGLLSLSAPDHGIEPGRRSPAGGAQRERDLLERQVRERTASLARTGHPPPAGA
jgi:CHASE3 domain sensor protein